MLSFWEKDTFLEYDYIIVGAGLTGLFTAIELKENMPKASVLILEKGILPSGASTKNAGFACFGSLTEILQDIKAMGEKACLRLIKKRYSGLENLKKTLGENNIDYQQNGGYELIREQELFALDELKRVNEWLYPIFEENLFEVVKEKVDYFGFNKKVVLNIVRNRFDGQLHPAKMIKTLWEKAQVLRVKILTGVEVKQVEGWNNNIKIEVWNEFYQKHMIFTAKASAICTNAFVKKLLPKINMNPGRGQAIMTNMIKDLKLKGIFYLDEGYYYFRNFGNRVILGGGRHLDFKKENTISFDYNAMIISDLEEKLRNIILPKHNFEITDKWVGIMGFTENKLPIIKEVKPHVWTGVALNGLGVALGSEIGKELAQKLINVI